MLAGIAEDRPFPLRHIDRDTGPRCEYRPRRVVPEVVGQQQSDRRPGQVREVVEPQARPCVHDHAPLRPDQGIDIAAFGKPKHPRQNLFPLHADLTDVTQAFPC